MRYFVFAFLFLTIISFQLVFGQDTLVFNKKYLPDKNKTIVFTPDGKNKPESGYPLLYLLHGYSGSSLDWNAHTSIQDYSNKYGFIIVCPDGYYDSWYVDSPLLPDNQYIRFFKNDLIPEIHKKYNIDTTEIFITGLSMGGHGAINFFIDNQDYFLSAGSMSGILDITDFPDKWEISKKLGDYTTNKQNWAVYSCVKKLALLKENNRGFIVDCGTEDFAYPVNLKFKKAADSLGIKFTFKTRRGAHDWNYWAESLPMHLEFFNSLIKNKSGK